MDGPSEVPQTDPVYEALFELAPDAILVVDAAGRVVRFNAQAEQVFGYARDEILGQPVEVFIPEHLRTAHRGHRVAYGEHPRTRRMGAGLELQGRRKDGSQFPVEVALASIAQGGARGGEAGGALVLAIIRDVTTRKAAEDELRRAHDELEQRVAERTRELSEANRTIVEEHAKLLQAEKLSSIGMLAAGVAHEINNPLSGVMGLVKALHDGGVPDGRREEYFETVRDGLDRIRLIVQGLLDYARPRPPSRAEVDLLELVAGCVRLVTPATRKKDLRVVFAAAPSPALVVTADRAQLMQVVVNVLMNAVYASPPSSEIAISTATEAGRPGQPGRIGVCVADHGPGIARDDIARICDPFFTTKPEGEGTGLGLAITLGIVRAHGGELAIDSEVGHGARVTIWLPAREGALGVRSATP